MDESQIFSLYIASISSNREIKWRQQKMEHVLMVKHIPFHKVDIVNNEEDKLRMRELCGDEKALPPKLFKGEVYLGDFEAFDNAVEEGKLNEFLRL